MKRIRLSIVPALFLLVAGTAGASQLAQFTEVNQTNDFIFTNFGTGVDFDATSLINFTFAPGLGTPYDGVAREATLTLTSSSDTAATNVGGAGGTDTNGGFTGTFTIIDMLTGKNLLSGTFGPQGSASGTDGGHSATFSDSTPGPSEVVFTSDFLNFTISTTQAFSISLSNVLPDFGLGAGGFLSSSNGAGTGTFSAAPLPTSTTPEPATITTIGMALVGLSVFLRKKKRLS